MYMVVNLDEFKHKKKFKSTNEAIGYLLKTYGIGGGSKYGLMKVVDIRVSAEAKPPIWFPLYDAPDSDG